MSIDLNVYRPRAQIYSNESLATRWHNTGQGDPGADGAFQRDQQEADLRITSAAAPFTPVKTAADCFTPLNYLNTLHVAAASRLTNVFVMHGITVQNSGGGERETER